MSGPLDGLKVLDLTSNFMGPYASLLLADMGADVCKIESPQGDTTRQVGPSRNPGMAALFLHLNRNKRSMVIDLKQESGRETLQRMLGRADVLLHSLRPKTMAQLGLAYQDIRLSHPRLIYCGGFGFGQNGPYADRPAYDNLIQAATGVPMVQARKTEGPPTYVGTALVDRLVGMAMSNAVLGALHHRAQTGRGQEVSVPMLETFAHFFLGDHLYGHTFVPPLGDWGYARMTSPERRPFPTRDGYMAVDVYTDKHWQRLFALVGQEEMALDPRYATVQARAQHIQALNVFLGQIFLGRTTEEWEALLIEADIPVMRMNTPETVLSDPHMQSVGFISELTHPTEGAIRSLGIATQWSDCPTGVRWPAPRLGEHTRMLLGEYGFASAEVDDLLATAAVAEADSV